MISILSLSLSDLGAAGFQFYLMENESNFFAFSGLVPLLLVIASVKDIFACLFFWVLVISFPKKKRAFHEYLAAKISILIYVMKVTK